MQQELEQIESTDVAVIDTQIATGNSSLLDSNKSHTVDRVRICHVSMSLLTGGLERLLVDFSRYHDHNLFDLHFIALSDLGQPAEDIRASNCQVHELENKAGKLQRISELASIFRREQINLVHTHNTYAHFYGALAAKLAGVPYVINTQHGRGCGPSWKARAQFRIANRFTNQIIGVSEDAAHLCQGEDRFSARKIDFIWNGIDLNRFTFHGPSDKLVAISVARLSPEKDFATLLKAVAIVLREVPNFELRIIGNGPEKENLEQLAARLDIQHNVKFYGERNDVPKLLADAGFFVSSTLTEGISLTLLEAMAVGLPVLTTAVGGNPEIVDEPKTGYLVPAKNPDAVAAGIINMCREKENWPTMGSLGRQRVEQHFEIRKMIQKYELLYQDVLNTRKQSHR